MTSGIRVLVAPLLCLAACGGGGGGGGGISVNAWTGTLNVAAGTATGTCAVTHTVTMSGSAAAGGGATPSTVNAAAGDCIQFTVADGTTHQPVAREASGCGELDAGQIDATTTSRVTVPFSAPTGKVCHWADELNPPPAPGGGGGGGTGY